MARNISGKSFDRNKYVLQHNNGGSGCISIKELCAKFGLVVESEINQPGGILGYDANGKIPASLVGDVSDSTIINGPTAINAMSSADYTIANYNSQTVYNITFTGGTFVRDGNKITVTAGNSIGSFALSVNGTVINISVVSFGPNKPTVTSSGVILATGSRLSISTSAYSSTNGSTHGSTSWQVASDAAFATILYNSVDNATNKTSVVTDVGVATTYYIRARFKDQYNVYGLWSETVVVTRASLSATVGTPVLTVDGVMNGAGAIFTITSTAFTDTGGSTHKNTTWQVAGDAAFTDIIYNNTDTVNKVSKSITVAEARTTYYFRANYVANNDAVSLWSTTVSKVYTSIPSAIPKNEEAKLVASDPATNDYFGRSISISNDGSRVAVGAYNKTDTANQQGAAYIFSRTGTTWTQEAKLVASDPANNDQFGQSISISNDGSRVAVGAYYKTGTAGVYQGAVYIFSRSGTTWTQEAKLVASDPAASDHFGRSISISNDGSRVAVGAYNKTDTANQQGAVYIFSRSGTTWTQEAKLVVNDPAAYDRFGFSVSISNDGSRVAVGAYSKAGTAGAGQGAVYIFSRTGTTWTQEAKLVASDPAASDHFGWPVSISGDGSRVAVGAYNKTDTANQQGAAYIFSRTGTTWTQEAKLVHSDPAGYDYFGWSISISNDGSRVAVGAYYKTGTASYQGAAYIFSRTGTTWTQEAKLVVSDPANNDYFGQSISISNDGSRVAVGAYSKTGTAGAYQGAAYIFS